MKNRARYMLFTLIVSLFFITSCFEDKGNYDYVDIKDAAVNIPEVTQNKGQISRDRYSVLELNPEIVLNDGASAAEFDFEWSLYSQHPLADDEDHYAPKKIMGNEQTLKYTLVEAPDKYYVVLKVTHKVTKVCTDYRFKLDINSIKGWLIYDENAAGEGDFQIVRDAEIVPGLSVSQKGVVRNYFSASNSGKKLRDGKFLGRRNMNNAYDHLFLFKADGVVKMEAGSYEVLSEDYGTLFMKAPKVNAPMAHYYPSPVYGAVEILVNDNEVHLVKWNTMGQKDQLAAPLASWGVPYKMSSFIAPIPVVSGNTNRAVLYDIKSTKGQFVTITNNGGTGYLKTPTGVFNTGAINPDKTTKLQLKYMGQGRDGITCAIFKDALAAEKPWLYVADLRTTTPLALAKHDLSGLENINAANQFVFGTRGDVMFYAAGSSVYSYLFGSTGVTTILSKAGEEIVSMKLYTHFANEDYSGRILFVATYDGSQGRVYKIKFNELNGQVEGEIESFTGFGKVIDMIDKE
ncbi:MAG: PKD-like family lipoprotein [Odoribacter sp.]